MFSVWSFISSNFSPDENFKILLSLLSAPAPNLPPPPPFDFEKFQFLQILLSSKVQSSPSQSGRGSSCFEIRC